MAGFVITRKVAAEDLTCLKKVHLIAAGEFYCNVNFRPREHHRGGWPNEDHYCEPCAIEKYARYRRILEKLGADT